MHKKFVVFINIKFEPVIVLDNVWYHKEINFPENFGKPAVRCGGGWWDVNNGTLKLYDDSGDFGKYDLETVKEAFVKHNVYYKDNAAANDKANKWHFTVA